MVFMAVCNDKGTQFFSVFFKIRSIGNDIVDPQHIFARESKTAVYHDHVVSIFKGGHIFADLTDSAKRYDPEFFLRFFLPIIYRVKTTLNFKLNNKIPFKQQDIIMLSNILEIPKNEIADYFFTLKV